MLNDHLEAGWIDAFSTVFELCKINADERVVILSETQSRDINLHLAELALARIGCKFFHIRVPTPSHPDGPLVRSSGASLALTGQDVAVKAICEADVVIDMTLEGLMHARETGTILKSGTRIMNISNEHPEALARTVPTPELKDVAKAAVAQCRAATTMKVTSKAGSDLVVNMEGAATAGVWGWTDRPGTLAHWPGGIIVAFPKPGSANGRLVFQPGDMNLTFKRYFESEVVFTFEEDYVVEIGGNGVDARLMRDYLASFGEKEAYAISHVGWGFNPGARYEALTMYDKGHINCTELRAVPGNFLFSTGANEFAGRFTRGHFDLPMMDCTIKLDTDTVIEDGKLV